MVNKATIVAVAALVFVVVLTLLPTDVSTAHNGTSHKAALQRMVTDVNTVRSEHGVPALATAPSLVKAADHYAQVLCDTEVFEHADDIGVPGWIVVGENIGMTDGPIRWLGPAFEDSPGHLANIVDVEYTHMGVGTCRAQDGTFYVVYRFGGNP